MNIPEILFLSVGLAMDAFAVAIACGFTIKQPKISHAFKIALFFGVFQFAMPLLGWALASNFREGMQSFDHWIAFGLLVFIGAKMIFEGFKSKDEQLKTSPLQIGTLLMLSVATSIDALAAGISFSFLRISIWLPVITIGVVTFAFSFLGVKIGSKFGHYLEHRVQIVGGLVLIGLGVKILAEHLMV